MVQPIDSLINKPVYNAVNINNKDLTVEQKEEKLTVIDKDIAELKKQAAVVRKQNMKDFESILTKDQKKTLKQMKKEGRAKFEQKHKFPKPPCPPPPAEK